MIERESGTVLLPVRMHMWEMLEYVADVCGIELEDAADYMLCKGIGYFAFEEHTEALQRPLLRYNNAHLTDEQFAALLPEWA
jgi:hypothetical protein